MNDEVAEMLTASQMLKQARESKGLSQDEVAQELFLTPAYIRQIDNDEIDKIAKQAFVRGYLRSYAKMVQLNGDEVVARFEKSQGTAPQKIEIRGVTQEPVGSTSFTGPVFQTGVIGLVGLVVVVSSVWFLSSSPDDEPAPADREVIEEPSVQSALAAEPTADLASTIDAVEEEANDFAEPVTEREVEQEEVQVETRAETALNLSAAEASTQPLEVDAQPSNSAITNAAVETTNELTEFVTARSINVERDGEVVRVDAGGSDELKFSFSDECWIEIEDGQGQAIYGDLNRSGDELIVLGEAPFEILFGKAPAVLMEYNGSPFDLAPHTTSVETAKVTVGN